jgi:hypothetical protein
MSSKIVLLWTTVIVLLFGVTVSPSSAQKLVLLGPQQQLIAALYEGSGPNASTAVFVFHDTANFIGAPPCLQLNQRGFTALCTNNPFPSTGQVVWDQVALDIGYGVSYLRSLPGIQHVVLVGHSGGVPTWPGTRTWPKTG